MCAYRRDGPGERELTKTNSPKTVATTVASKIEGGTSDTAVTHWRHTAPQDSMASERVRRRLANAQTGEIPTGQKMQ